MTHYRSEATDPIFRVAQRVLEQLGALSTSRDENAARWRLPSGGAIWLFRASTFATPLELTTAIEQCLRDRDSQSLDVIVVGGAALVESAVDSARAPPHADAYGKIHVSDTRGVRGWAASRALERALRDAVAAADDRTMTR